MTDVLQFEQLKNMISNQPQTNQGPYLGQPILPTGINHLNQNPSFLGINQPVRNPVNIFSDPLNQIKEKKDLNMNELRDFVNNLERHKLMKNAEKTNHVQAHDYYKKFIKENLQEKSTNIPVPPINYKNTKIPDPLIYERDTFKNIENQNLENLSPNSRKEAEEIIDLRKHQQNILLLQQQGQLKLEKVTKDLIEARKRHLTNKDIRRINNSRKNRVIIDVINPLGWFPYFTYIDPKTNQEKIQKLSIAKHYKDDEYAPYIDRTTNLVFNLRKSWFDFFKEKITGSKLVYDSKKIRHFIPVKDLTIYGLPVSIITQANKILNGT